MPNSLFFWLLLITDISVFSGKFLLNTNLSRNRLKQVSIEPSVSYNQESLPCLVVHVKFPDLYRVSFC
jgi:hypothetical protein